MPDPGKGSRVTVRPDPRRHPPDPAPSGRPVPRQRLLSALSRAVDRAPVTLLSGPAGSGKTVLAATWARRAGAYTAVGWISLARDDLDPAEFWTAALLALDGAGVPLPDVPRPVPGERLPGDFVDRLAGSLAVAATPVVLVLDNADHLHDELVAGVDQLVTRAAARLLLVLTASADPVQLLARYRADGALAEIRGEELAFRPSETEALLGRLGTPVSPAAAEALTEAVDGLAVGLRMVAAELAGDVPVERLLADLAGTDDVPVHHLAAAVLAAQAPPLREFLLRVSATERLWPELVRRLTGVSDVDRPLAALARAHAFVEADDRAPGGYRIPGLLRGLLSAQLAAEAPQEFTAMQRMRDDWYAAAGPLRDGVLPVVPTPRRPAPPEEQTPSAPWPDGAVPELSPREGEVLRRLADGRSTRQLAVDLAISANTVRGHIHTLRRKLAAADRSAVVGRARDLGLL
jgi:LuxR family maltose regulon positive regulatory protein